MIGDVGIVMASIDAKEVMLLAAGRLTVDIVGEARTSIESNTRPLRFSDRGGLRSNTFPEVCSSSAKPFRSAVNDSWAGRDQRKDKKFSRSDAWYAARAARYLASLSVVMVVMVASACQNADNVKLAVCAVIHHLHTPTISSRYI